MTNDFNGPVGFAGSDRRGFLKSFSVLGAAFVAKDLVPSAAVGQADSPSISSRSVPRRAFGRTGVQVSLIGVGGHTVAMAEFAARRAMARRVPGGVSATEKAELLEQVAALTREHRRLWKIRARLGGLDHSCGFYEQIAAKTG